MTAIIIFIVLIIALNCIPILTKTSFPKTERVIVRLLIASTILFIAFTILELFGYRLKGIYTFPIVGGAFLILTITYFALSKNTKQKVRTILILTPLVILNSFTLSSRKGLKEFRINDSTKITVTTGGLLACGENIKISESKFRVFDKEVHNESTLCLRGIVKIETAKFDDRHAEFLIYHNAEMDSENPYKYYVDRKNGW